MTSKRFDPEPTSAPGDFYVVNGECIGCGIPHVVAPDLIGWVSDEMSHCCWKKQPETDVELKQAFAVFEAQEAGCHRYAGTDPKIISKIGGDNCDNPGALTGYWAGRSGDFSKAFWKRMRRSR